MHRGTECLTYRITQLLTDHGCFGNYLHRNGANTSTVVLPSTRSVARSANLLNTLLRSTLCLLRNADRFSTSSGMISPPASLVHYSAVTVQGTHSQTSARIILVLGTSLQGRELHQYDTLTMHRRNHSLICEDLPDPHVNPGEDPPAHMLGYKTKGAKTF